MNKLPFYLCMALLLFGCDKSSFENGQFFYQDNFSTYTRFEELFPDSDAAWTSSQLTGGDNLITVDTSFFKSPPKSLRFTATKSSASESSKCSLVKQNMGFLDEDRIRLTASYFIEGDAPVPWLFLLDLEEKTAVGANPGMRLALVEDQLVVEFKFNQDNIFQPAGQGLSFPRNEWVEVIWEITLSTQNAGSVQLWQNGDLVIEASNIRTLPRDLLYFQQGTKGIYNSVEIGITANTEANDLRLWVDDVLFERVD